MTRIVIPISEHSQAKYSLIGTLKQRLQELIDEFSDGKLTKFAKLCGIPQGTLHAYKGGRLPTAEYLIRIKEECGINIDWLLTGDGPKYHLPHSESCDLDPDPEVAQLIEGARRVLTSGNTVAFDALERNIRYFDHAIAAEIRADQMAAEVQANREEIRAHKEEMQIIKAQLAELLRVKEKREDEEDTGSSSEAAA